MLETYPKALGLLKALCEGKAKSDAYPRLAPDSPWASR
jgi:hypothetical protein